MQLFDHHHHMDLRTCTMLSMTCKHLQRDLKHSLRFLKAARVICRFWKNATRWSQLDKLATTTFLRLCMAAKWTGTVRPNMIMAAFCITFYSVEALRLVDVIEKARSHSTLTRQMGREFVEALEKYEASFDELSD